MTAMDTVDANVESTTSSPETSLVETEWGGRIVASAFVVLATGLSWVFAATALIG